jgi:hypothetical protein
MTNTIHEHDLNEPCTGLKSEDLGNVPPEYNNVQLVYIGLAESWKERFSKNLLINTLRSFLSLEFWWRLVEVANAISYFNVSVSKRPNDKFSTISLYHKDTRSRIVLRGDGNVDIHSNRHVYINGVLALIQCSEQLDENPVQLWEK